MHRQVTAAPPVDGKWEGHMVKITYPLAAHAGVGMKTDGLGVAYTKPGRLVGRRQLEDGKLDERRDGRLRSRGRMMGVEKQEKLRPSECGGGFSWRANGARGTRNWDIGGWRRGGDFFGRRVGEGALAPIRGRRFEGFPRLDHFHSAIGAAADATWIREYNLILFYFSTRHKKIQRTRSYKSGSWTQRMARKMCLRQRELLISRF
ncbi:hypothetical protein DFH09DRAFT_1096013 [Mycena vulgaris]|nr:hypothetical protein DFH09DRAFT_1096013 [Mycena vulgaris]